MTRRRGTGAAALRAAARPGVLRPPTALARPPARGFRIEHAARPAAELTSSSAEPAEPAPPSAAAIYVFEPIDSWGAPYGVSAADFVAALQLLDVDVIDLHLNSPGGDYFEAVTIFNALRQHRAGVTVYVDGMAASAASVVAMAGDRVVMGRGAQLMIHNSRTIAIGTADDMRAVAESLDMVDSDIASFYAERAQVTGVGTSAETFRDAMRAETWYTAAAAVAIGLADEQGEDAGDEPAEDEPAGDEPAEDEPAEDEPAEDGEDDEPESLAGMAAAMAPDRWIAAMQAWAPAPPRRRARPSRAAAAAPRPPRAAPAGRQPAPPVAFPLTPSTFRAAIRRAHP